ncbi:metallophosphoesterase [Deinococcus roseus]|uniref:Calcineurin-like phosphoesterase domain-containing protein n=1 Tax=Deinococcus roseus TaxID=392414 RepID=A0ABQ2D4L9_9DEIO|nr:metallophosphoesterase [Deinococcus roseus]GGJ46042.1 hypothetical protein GCM10008938_35310 [Deinococcus roseus]
MYDIIGDIHGCSAELQRLLKQLGYSARYRHPDERQLVFVGDIADRGPQVVEAYQLVMRLVREGVAQCVMGNHDLRILNHLSGQGKIDSPNTRQSIQQIEAAPRAFQADLLSFLSGLPSQLMLDHGMLMVAHAGLPAEFHGVNTQMARDIAIHGERVMHNGKLTRVDWTKDYHGLSLVVYGHTPVRKVRWVNNTVNIDTGCVFGGKLTALLYPERTTVSVPASRVYNIKSGVWDQFGI